MQKELVLQFPKRKISHCIQSAIMHSQSRRGYHNASLLPSPQVSLSDAPFLGAPRRWSVSSTYWGKISWLRFDPRALPDPMASPGELFCPSNGSGQGSAIQIVGTPFQEYHQVSCYLVHLGAPSLWPGWATSPVDQGAWVVGISLEPPEML